MKKSSLRLFTIRGIDVRVHMTFPLILLWAAFQFGLADGYLSSALFGVTAVTLLFVLVTLHELGHSFAAQYYGVSVKQIVLSPLGGVAQLESIPDKPVQELVIAVAGPAVNVIVAILLGLLAVPLGISLSASLAALSGAAGFSLAALFSYVFVYNIFLAVFNLLPAFPMDGGRILRALLALRLNYVRATDIAATIGRGFALLMGLYGLFNGGIFLLLIAVFIYSGATQEAKAVRVKARLQELTVQQVLTSAPYRLAPEMTLQQAMQLMLAGNQSVLPVCTGEELVGMLTRSRLMAAWQLQHPLTAVGAVMQNDLRPVSPEMNLFVAQESLQGQGVSVLPVVSGSGRFLGLLTWQNIQRAFQSMMAAPPVMPKTQTV